MTNFNYDLVELRFNELEDIYIVEVVYDEDEYYRISCIADIENNLISINTNLTLQPGETSYFETITDNQAIQQFVGVSKVVFNNLIVDEVVKDDDFEIVIHNIDFTDALELRSNFIKTLRQVDADGIEIPESIIDKYNQLMFSIDSNFLTGEILMQLLAENKEEQNLN